jgi:sirohydrochlorin ferrochelatase
MPGGAQPQITHHHGRLLQDQDAVVEQFVAADALLVALGRSSSDDDAVLETVAESARRLCRCGVQIYLLHGNRSS